MPPVLGPRSPSPNRLKSCAGASGTPVERAVAQHQQRQLGAGESLLDHDRAAGVAERAPGEVLAHRVARVGERLGDEHALARGEAVGLDHVEARAASRGTRAPASSSVAGERRVAGGGDLGRRPGPPSSTPSSPRGGPPRPTGRTRRRPARAARRRDRRRAGASGPTTTRSRVSRLSIASSRGRHAATSAIPGFPGAASTASTTGDRARPHASACSRRAAPDDEDLHVSPARRDFVAGRRTLRVRTARPRAASVHRSGDLASVQLRRPREDDRLVAGRADRHERHVDAGVGLDELHVVARLRAGGRRAARPVRCRTPSRGTSRRSA